MCMFVCVRVVRGCVLFLLSVCFFCVWLVNYGERSYCMLVVVLTSVIISRTCRVTAVTSGSTHMRKTSQVCARCSTRCAKMLMLVWVSFSFLIGFFYLYEKLFYLCAC